jgi:drug/metabolite transporter, DME family
MPRSERDRPVYRWRSASSSDRLAGFERSESRGYLYVLLAASLWALLTPASRMLLERGVGAFEIAFWRSTVAWILFSLHLALTRSRWRTTGEAMASPFRIAPSDAPGILTFGVVGIAILYVALPLAVEAGGAALASILLYTAPAWVAILAWPLLGERLNGRKALALVLTLAGIAAFGLSGDGGIRPSPAAIGWGLLSGLSYASLYLFGKRYFERYSPATVFFWALPAAMILVLPGTDFSARGAVTWAALLAIGTLSTYGAYLAYSAGLRRLEATRASVIATLEPVLAGLLAFVLWRERFAPVGYAGGVLILLGVLLMARAGPSAPGRLPAS